MCEDKECPYNKSCNNGWILNGDKYIECKIHKKRILKFFYKKLYDEANIPFSYYDEDNSISIDAKSTYEGYFISFYGNSNEKLNETYKILSSQLKKNCSVKFIGFDHLMNLFETNNFNNITELNHLKTIKWLAVNNVYLTTSKGKLIYYRNNSWLKFLVFINDKLETFRTNIILIHLEPLSEIFKDKNLFKDFIIYLNQKKKENKLIIKKFEEDINIDELFTSNT